MTETQTAPGELEQVRRFVNTLDVEDAIDDVGEWLAARGVRPTAAAAARAAQVREALRDLLLANNGWDVDVAVAAARLDEAARRARLTVRFGADGAARLEPSSRGVDAELGRLLAIVAAAEADGTWGRLKACRADDCRWAFYDHAKNRSRTWCSMAVCGNRQKARAYRLRHAQ